MSMIIYIVEGLLVLSSIIYYMLSGYPECLIFAGFIFIAMILERLIVVVDNTCSLIEDIEFQKDEDTDYHKWVDSSKALPPEPAKDSNGRVEYVEYNVVTDRGIIATTLEYRGSNGWYERNSGCSYTVLRWRELPNIPKDLRTENGNAIKK